MNLTGRVAFEEDPKDTLGVSINLATFIIGGTLHDEEVVKDWFIKMHEGFSRAVEAPPESFSLNTCAQYILFFAMTEADT